MNSINAINSRLIYLLDVVEVSSVFLHLLLTPGEEMVQSRKHNILEIFQDSSVQNPKISRRVLTK